MYKGGSKLLQFLFLFIVFLIFCIILLTSLTYTYNFNFQFKQCLNYNFSFSVLFIEIIFKKTSKEQSVFLKIFNFNKKLNLNNKNNNKILNLVQNKSKKIIKEKIENKAKLNKEKSSKSDFKFDFNLINKENLNHIFKFIIEMIKILKMDYLNLYLHFSFADPYYNGIFLAYYYTFKELFDYPDLKVKINWQEVIFEAEGSMEGSIVPLKIVWHFLKFIFSFKSLKILWKLYQNNSKKG